MIALYVRRHIHFRNLDPVDVSLKLVAIHNVAEVCGGSRAADPMKNVKAATSERGGGVSCSDIITSISRTHAILLLAHSHLYSIHIKYLYFSLAIGLQTL